MLQNPPTGDSRLVVNILCLFIPYIFMIKVKTGRRRPNVYVFVDAVKEDLKETERLIDLVQMGRLNVRKNAEFQKR